VPSFVWFQLTVGSYPLRKMNKVSEWNTVFGWHPFIRCAKISKLDAHTKHLLTKRLLDKTSPNKTSP
jgi:hypothetical protein